MTLFVADTSQQEKLDAMKDEVAIGRSCFGSSYIKLLGGGCLDKEVQQSTYINIITYLKYLLRVSFVFPTSCGATRGDDGPQPD